MKNYKISALILAAMASAGVSYAGTFGFEDVSSSLIPQNTGALQTPDNSFGAFKTSSQGVNMLSTHIHIIIGREALSPTKKATTQLII